MRFELSTMIAGLLLAAAVYAGIWQAGMTSAQSWTAAVTALCATWWICESLPVAATSLVPLVMFPLAGVLTERQAAAAYGDPLVLLFLGGFMLSRAAEHSGAHRQVASGILRLVGTTSGRRIVLGFMLATAVCSMWISNTATALMMLPVALAVVEQDKSGRLGTPLMLGVAYAANIGGMATPIGTPPNGVCLAVFREITGETISFAQWLAFGGVVTGLMFIAAWLILTARLSGVEPVRIHAPGPWTTAQKRVLAVFALAALAWVTRDVPLGGWSYWTGTTAAGDSTVALAAVLMLFLLPSGEGLGKRLLDWNTAVQIPWGVLLLFGGGIAIAAAFQLSGMSATIGRQLAGVQQWPIVLVIASVNLAVTFLTEVTSNTATATVLLPVLGAAAKAAGIAPALLMVPAAMSVSCAFMLPVATPPNAIVFGSGRIRMAQMARALAARAADFVRW
jgi:sodium-dependent dicarboxylate transporter 2/3/5